MKRLILAVLGLFLIINLCTAQIRQARVQRGIASQEMKAGGLSAAHSVIPLGTKVKVTNPANGLEIEVTITGTIPESYHRIIDLSPNAANALGLGEGGPVIISTSPNQPRVIPPVVVEPEPEPVLEIQEPPFRITINNYIVNPDPPPPPEEPTQEWEERPTRKTMLDEDIFANIDPPPPPEPEKPSLFNSPPVTNIQIIPGLPDPHTNKIYRLLVGTYPGVDNAFPICRQLQAAGFEVLQEQAGEMCKVFAAGIPASRVYYAAQRLGSIGFSQVWVYE